MKYLIIQDEHDTVFLEGLPAKATREEAVAECHRMNDIVRANNARFAQAQLEPHFKGKSFLFRRDDRIFDFKEIY